jgi:predicted Holliday junction resolvase-like endonuclease
VDEKQVLGFLNDKNHIFGICPCCNEIFSLSEVVISIGSVKTIKEKKEILKVQNNKLNLEDQLEDKENIAEDLKYEIIDLNDDLRQNDTEVLREVKILGRKEATTATKNLLPFFKKKSFDPRDARLIFSPISFVLYKGLTENKQVDEVLLISKKKKTTVYEKVITSIKSAVKKGNISFDVIRYNVKKGTISVDE